MKTQLQETYLVAENINNPAISIFKKKCFHSSILLSLHIFQIIGVNNSYNQAEFNLPSLPMMIPCKMLRLLKNSNICLFIRDDFRNISNRKNAPFIYWKLHQKWCHGLELFSTTENKNGNGNKTLFLILCPMLSLIQEQRSLHRSKVNGLTSMAIRVNLIPNPNTIGIKALL